MVLWNDTYEITDAVERDHDYWIEEKHPTTDRTEDEIERYRAWVAVDDDWTLIVSDRATDAAFQAANNADGWHSVVWEADANKERVKEYEMATRERVAYYLDDPPETRFQDISRAPCKRFLERREIWEEVDSHQESWFYPEREEFLVRYLRDNRETISVFDTLDDIDREILFEGYDPTGDEDTTRTPEDLADLIYERAPVGHRESSILARYITGQTSHADMADEMEVSRGSVASSAYSLEDKIDGWAWLMANVLANVPDGQLGEELQNATEVIPTGDPRSYDEQDIDGDTTLR